MEIHAFHRRRKGEDRKWNMKKEGWHYSPTTAASRREMTRPKAAVAGRTATTPEIPDFPGVNEFKVLGKKAKTTITVSRTTLERDCGDEFCGCDWPDGYGDYSGSSGYNSWQEAARSSSSYPTGADPLTAAQQMAAPCLCWRRLPASSADFGRCLEHHESGLDCYGDFVRP